MRRWLAPVAGLLVLLWFLRSPSVEPVDDYHIAMGTMVRMALYVDDPEMTTRVVELGRKAIADVEAIASHYDSSSELSKINRLAAQQPVIVSRSMADLLQRIERRTEQTENRFDPSRKSCPTGLPRVAASPVKSRMSSAI